MTSIFLHLRPQNVHRPSPGRIPLLTWTTGRIPHVVTEKFIGVKSIKTFRCPFLDKMADFYAKLSKITKDELKWLIHQIRKAWEQYLSFLVPQTRSFHIITMSGVSFNRGAQPP